MDFSKYDEMIDWSQLDKAPEPKPKQEKKEFEKVPDGEYFCDIERLQLGESKAGKPMLKAMLRIKEGDHERSCLFVNQVVAHPFGMHIALGLLKNLGTDSVDFDNVTGFDDLNDRISKALEEVQREGYYYKVSYNTNEKGFTDVKIIELY